MTIFVTVLYNIFMRQTLTDDFLGLHRNMNCAFPLRIITSAQITSTKIFAFIAVKKQSPRHVL